MLSLLDKRLQEGTLPQTLLLVGPPDPQLIKNLAKKIFGQSPKIDSGNHPDLHLLTLEEKNLHTVASIHTLLQEMALPPFEAPYKLLCILEAEKMLPAASNALLKALEEPPADTFFVLQTRYPEQLLATLRSRCTKIFTEISKNPSPHLDALFELARSRKWGELMQELAKQEEALATHEDLFEEFLPQLPPLEAMRLVEKAKTALQHNVRLRHILLHCFLEIA